MPTVAVVDGVANRFYPDGHPRPHFHAAFAEFAAQVRIEPPEALNGALPPFKPRAVLAWAGQNREGLMEAWLSFIGSWPKAEEVAMSEMVRMRSVEPVLFGVVKIVWLDGFEAIVDLRPVLAFGDIFAFLRREQDRFNTVTLDECGHSIRWSDGEGDEVDFGSDSLRRRAVRQAEILRLAS